MLQKTDPETFNNLKYLNPLRCRGYVYDTETQFYYLQSRYFDPEIARFINSDSYASTGQGILGNNMFAYCLNAPVNKVDIMGSTAADCLDDSPLDEEDRLKDSQGGGFDAQQAIKDGTFAGGYSCSNPGGRHGGPLHRSTVEMLRNFFSKLGYDVSSKEQRVPCGDSGSYRYPDLIVSNDDGVVYYVQVGRATSSGNPIAREQRAIDDLSQTGVDIWFVPYN